MLINIKKWKFFYYAFTIIELLVVMAILASVTVGLGWVLKSYDKNIRLVSAGEDFLTFLETLSLQASVSRNIYLLNFKPGDDNVKVDIVGTSEAKKEWVYRLPENITIFKILTDQGNENNEFHQVVVQPSGYIQDFTIFLGLEDRSIKILWEGYKGRGGLGVVNDADLQK
jgi:prepilin-type N-terminal cleavage/methylation domain-containing protein